MNPPSAFAHKAETVSRRNSQSPSGESNEIVRANPLQNEEHG
jgi:hypothetical protein